MKPIKENLGLYSILLALIFFLSRFLLQFKYGPNHSSQRIDLLFGPHAWIFLILLIAAIVSVFVIYKYSWIVIALPFLWQLLLPLKITPGSGFRGSIINFFATLFQGEIGVAIAVIFGTILGILSVIYLCVKNLKQIENKKFEIIFATLIIIFLLIRIF
jgi:hypothetical protein